nr:cold-shock protein [Pseudomonas fluorescens]
MAITKGTVKFYNDSKGFGFITSDDDNKDAFAHFSEIMGGGFKTLTVGQRVEFEVKDDARRGLVAVNIHPI